MDDKQLVLFDYGTLDLDTRSFVQGRIVEIRIFAKQTMQGVIEIGKRLIEIKEKLGHGNWLPFIKAELGWSESTVNRYTNVAKTFKSVNLTNLEIDLSSSYLLAAHSTQDDARQEAIERAKLGEGLTFELTKEIVEKHHKAKLDAMDKESAVLGDRIKTLEAQLHEAIKECDQMRLHKQADDADIIRQDELSDKLNKQIAELKAQVAEPQVITQEVKVEVEKRIEVIPDDYEQIKIEKAKMEKVLEREKAKTAKNEEEVKFQQRRINSLSDRLAKIEAEKDRILSNHTPEMRERKANSLLVQSHNKIAEALSLLNIDGQVRTTSQINIHVSTIEQEITAFRNINKIIDVEVN
jgi:chromosome segregation ATPase